MKKLIFAGTTLGVALWLAAGCGNDSTKDAFVTTYDAGSDASDASAEAASEAGIDPTLGGPCNEDAQCDDAIACTTDACDLTLSRCRNTPDNTKCDDGKYCDGVEICNAGQGCVPGPVVTCEDSNGCTIDSCVEATKSCTHVLRDADGDGDPDGHCPPGKDCDDTNPNVNSNHVEVCNNGIDDNCNGQIDEQPCSAPVNDTCATASTVSGSASLLLTTVAASEDYPTSCATNITGGQDIVVAIQVPAGGAQNIALRAKADTANVAITLESTCGVSASEIQCINLMQSDTRALAYNVAGGSTIYAILTTSSESTLSLDVSFESPTPAPTNEDCSAPAPIALNTAIPVSLVGVKRDIDSTCTSTTGDLTYSFTLATAQDVKIFASTTLGSGDPIVSLRGTDCVNDETTCHEGDTLPLFRRSMPAGTYTIAVSGTGQIDENVIVETSAPTTGPADQFCGSAPPLAQLNDTETVDLTNHESIVDPGCGVTSLAGDPTAVRLVTLEEASDVLVVGRFAQNDIGLVALTQDDCEVADNSFCTSGSTPQHVSKHGLPADNYQVVMTDSLGLSTSLTTLVRSTIDATPITNGDACADVASIPATGGYFSGDTAMFNADFDAGCDDIGQPANGAKDQLLTFTLTAEERVIFDMTGSQYTTLLDLRTGATCPGTEVTDGCARPYNSAYSFLDVTLPAGTYYVQIDGVASAAGPWMLDMRVIDP